MNTSMIGFLDGFQEYLCPCALDKSSLRVGRVNDPPLKNIFQILFKLSNKRLHHGCVDICIG